MKLPIKQFKVSSTKNALNFPANSIKQTFHQGLIFIIRLNKRNFILKIHHTEIEIENVMIQNKNLSVYLYFNILAQSTVVPDSKSEPYKL